MSRKMRSAVAALVVAAGWACRAAEPTAPADGAARTAGRATASPWPELFARLSAGVDQSATVVGDDGWLFFAAELRHLSLGRFWGEDARSVSRAADPENADPVAAIVDFHRQLQDAGIELLFVPVPAKAAIYPEHLPGDPPSAISPDRRVDGQDRAILAELAAVGVPVLDLGPIFLAAKAEGEPLFCRSDTHWSPRGIAMAAEAIVERIGDRPWFPDRFITDIDLRVRPIEIAGDLWQRLPEPRPARETIEATFFAARHGKETVTFPTDRQSPVLLLGDSHGLVFHAGADMHAEGAGLPEHLAWRLGFGVDVVAVRGSGATPARINLLRRGDGLAGKRLVVWVISVREYTEGQGWARVPTAPP